MDRRYHVAALIAAGMVASACGGGSPNAAGGAAGEEMQAESQADGYPDVRLEADGGSVSDSTGGYMNSATGTTGGGTGGTPR